MKTEIINQSQIKGILEGSITQLRFPKGDRDYKVNDLLLGLEE